MSSRPSHGWSALPWPFELMMVDVYSSSTRAAADLAGRAAYFIGEASMRLRVIRSRFARFLLAHSVLLRILGVASPADAWRLGCALAERVEPGASLGQISQASTCGAALSAIWLSAKKTCSSKPAALPTLPKPSTAS